MTTQHDRTGAPVLGVFVHELTHRVFEPGAASDNGDRYEGHVPPTDAEADELPTDLMPTAGADQDAEDQRTVDCGGFVPLPGVDFPTDGDESSGD